MKYLGIDFGTKKIGLALSDGFLPYPYKTVSIKEAVREIVKLVDKEKIRVIVIGQPTRKISRQFRQFYDDLKLNLSVELVIWDETLSSRKAQAINVSQSRKKKKELEHALAASIILEDFLANKIYE